MSSSVVSKKEKGVVLIVDHENIHLAVVDPNSKLKREGKPLKHYHPQILINKAKDKAGDEKNIRKDLSKVYFGPSYHKLLQQRRRMYKYGKLWEETRDGYSGALQYYEDQYKKHGINIWREETVEKESTVDLKIACDVMNILCKDQEKKEVDIIILCTGDKDYIPLIKEIKRYNKVAIGIGVGDGKSAERNAASDDLIREYNKYNELGFEYHNYIELFEEWEREQEERTRERTKKYP